MFGRQLRYIKSELIRGWYEIPYLYFTGVLFLIGTCGTFYHVRRLPSTDNLITRHKERYIVIRPDDPRLLTYPPEYVTDKDVIDNYLKKQEELKQKN